MTMTEVSVDFRSLVRSTQDMLVLKPLLARYLLNAEFPDKFAVTFHKAGMPRRPDNYFHPSTHPLWSARQLYYYLAEPDKMVPESLDVSSRMAVTMGTAVHAFIEMCLRDAGVMAPLEGTCPACKRKHGTRKGQCDEYGAADEELGSRGHMDGVVDIDLTGRHWQPGRGVFEFKCLAHDVMLSMADGSLRRADRVAVGERVLGWDESAGRLAPGSVVSIQDNGIVPVWTVRTREGRSVRVTDEHPFLTTRGWVKARHLERGDLVRVAFGDASWHESGASEVSQVEAYALGALVGDGSFTRHGVSFTHSDRGVVDAMREYVENVGCSMRSMSNRGNEYRISGTRRADGSYRDNEVKALLRRVGLDGCRASEKHIPRAVMSAGPRQWVEFLSGYFDTDGTVISGKPYPHLGWSSTSRTLLEQCQLLLGYLGVRSSIVKLPARYKGEPYDAWNLLVRDATSVMVATGVLHPRSWSKSSRLQALDLPEPKKNFHRTAHLGWDYVTESVEGSAEPTLAIEMSGHTHVTNGLVTHNTTNSAKARRLADLDLEAFKKVCPDYYAQVQEYMRMTGYRQALVVFVVLGYPWEIIEVQVPYDPMHALQVASKYRAVREAVAVGEPPRQCCGSPSGCGARVLCHSQDGPVFR